jgi:hypothetical protein
MDVKNLDLRQNHSIRRRLPLRFENGRISIDQRLKRGKDLIDSLVIIVAGAVGNLCEVAGMKRIVCGEALDLRAGIRHRQHG